ncbi:MAG: HIT family protein [Candidatus Pacebacteria bacterium]|nr:HIT family protein [Candidatus Paceibacterota bacterium]
MNTDCLFCKIVAGEIPSYKIFEDADFIGIVDIQPVNLGHALLIPKKHVINLLDMPADLLAKLGTHLQTLSQAVKEVVQADGVNVIMNNERAAGQLIFHQHSHIIPRFTNDGLEPWHNKVKPTPEELEATRQKLSDNLN